MVRVVLGLCGAVLALTACSSKSDDPGQNSASSGASDESVLTRITEQQACELLDGAAIKKALDVDSAQRQSRRVGKAPVTVTYLCDYHTGVPGLSSEVATTRDDESDKQVIDNAFTNRAVDKPTPGKYEDVPGVGGLAGFGKNATLSGGGLNGQKLAVVFKAGGQRLTLEVSVLGNAKLDQLKPLATELVTKLQTAVGK